MLYERVDVTNAMNKLTDAVPSVFFFSCDFQFGCRKHPDRIEHPHPAYCSAHYVDVDTEPSSSEHGIL